LKDDRGEHPLIPRSQLRIPGDHNVENALAAAVLAGHSQKGPPAFERRHPPG